MSGKPERFFIALGTGRGGTGLNAFDNALRDAGVGDYNLLRVSSILPKTAKERQSVDLPKGSLLPIAYGTQIGTEEGRWISAAIGIGLPREAEGVGVIMECEGYFEAEEAEERVRRMAEEALRARDLTPEKILARSASLLIRGPSCTFAGVALW